MLENQLAVIRSSSSHVVSCNTCGFWSVDPRHGKQACA